MSRDDEIRIILERLAQLTGQPPPPGITPDALATGTSPLSQLLRLLGLAANGGDPGDMTAAEDGYAERSAKTGDALAKFPANEEESAGKLGGVGSPAEMAQQIPQMISGVAGGISGAMQGLLQPLSQLPQQAAQIGQQMMQTGMGALQQGAEGAAGAGAAIPGELTGSTSGGAGAGGGGVGGGLGSTTPTSSLNPLPAPSAGTEPASSRTTSVPPPSASSPTNAPRGGVGAMPMMPPGAMHGAGAGKDDKPDTKRVVPPRIRNGAPVQGRITTPPPTAEVIKRVEGKPVASRRIILPDQKLDDDDKDGDR